VLRLRSVIAAAAVVVSAAHRVALGPADAGEPASSSILFFTGTDMWRDGAFIYGGLLWSPAGLNSDGFTLKLLLDGGNYSYPSAGLHTDVTGTLSSAAALPGWRITRDALTVSLYAGPLVQDYRLTPYDPGSRLHGSYVGGQLAADVWYQPTPVTMVAL
jgi:hypothetical protein